MLKDINIDGILEASRLLANRTITIGGERHGSPFIFNQCMRAFDHKALPAQAITFSVYLNAPIMAEGEATIYRDGRLEIRRS